MSEKDVHKPINIPRHPAEKPLSGCGDTQSPKAGPERRLTELEMQIQKLRDSHDELQNIKQRLEKQVRQIKLEMKQTSEKFDQSQKELRVFAQDAVNRLESERLKVSLQLHDTIAQSLATMKLFLENKLVRMGGEQIPSSYSIESILEIIRDTLNEVRWLINYLRPKMLDEIGLLATIQWHWRDFCTRHPDLAVKMNLTATEADIPAKLKLFAYRIIQEATHNIESHGQALRIEFDLTRVEQTLQLRIRDNGKGFNVERIRSKPELNPSLARMKAYAELSGGRFVLRSSKNQGTCVEAVWDLGDQQDFQTK